MAKRRRMLTVLPAIWNVPDELWELIQPILDELDPPAATGRPRVDPRAALDGIIYRMRTGCQWNQLPKAFGDDSSVHRTFQRWEQKGVLDRIWSTLVKDCDELGGVNREWQSADGAMGKARLEGPRRSEPDRPCEQRNEAQPPGGSRRRSAVGRRGRRQCARRETAGAHARCHRRRAS